MTSRLKADSIAASGGPIPFSNVAVFHELIKTVVGDNANNEFDLTAHGYPDDLRFLFTGTPPAELDTVTVYWIVNSLANTLQVSLTQGGSAITFTDNGTSVVINPQFVVPDGVTRIYAEVYGGGGGGGGGQAGVGSGTGGGASGPAEGFLTVTPGAAIPVVIGVGGAAGASNTDGVDGVDSSFLTLTGVKGKKGLRGAGGAITGGTGGLGTGGDINMKGSGGGGGSSGGTESSGKGGSNKRGGGGRGVNGGFGPGGLFGGGGSGGSSGGGSGSSGGTGGVILWF